MKPQEYLSRIKKAHLLHAFPIEWVAQKNLLGGAQLPFAPGRVAVLVRGRITHVMDREERDMAIPRQFLGQGSYVAYITPRRKEIAVEIKTADKVRSQDDHPCSGIVTFDVVAPDNDVALQHLVLDQVTGSGEQICNVQTVARRVRVALVDRLCQEARKIPYSDWSARRDEICSALSDNPGEVKADLKSMGLYLIRTSKKNSATRWRVGLKASANPMRDEQIREEKLTALQNEVQESSDPAHAVAQQLIAIHNDCPDFRVNLRLTRHADRAQTRGFGPEPQKIYEQPNQVHSGAFQRGDAISLDIETRRGGYLYILNVDAQGTLSQVFPNPVQSKNLFRAEEPFRLPDSMSEFFGGPNEKWRIFKESPVGEEYVKVLVTDRPLNLLPPESDSKYLFYRRSAKDALLDLTCMAKILQDLPPDAWADCACWFQVV